MFGKLKGWCLTRETSSTGIPIEDLRDLYTDPPQSFSGRYPNAPSPESSLSPTILAARWTTHALHPEDLPSIAADLLEEGFDTPGLRRLAGEIQLSNSADAEPIVSRVFHELGVNYPLRPGEAEFIAVRQIAREVIAGQRNPWAAANHIEIVICGFVPETPLLKTICSINDEISWDAPHRRPIKILSTELLDTFASVAKTSEFDQYQRLE